ncbi:MULTISPECIES: hypothetical protein [Listeria]|uniref:hypothetical protein n=1 Tax=Listeria TaxID=1637 RepID=UPI000EF491CA|nr:hypothetical protein [Listeria monocytogenes]EDN8844105.1 hypothetical protein [Listeria monocytogenes]RLQ42732.1 hypothetical protein ABY69_02890 [Listeria monocytogenes]
MVHLLNSQVVVYRKEKEAALKMLPLYKHDLFLELSMPSKGITLIKEAPLQTTDKKEIKRYKIVTLPQRNRDILVLEQDVAGDSDDYLTFMSLDQALSIEMVQAYLAELEMIINDEIYMIICSDEDTGMVRQQRYSIGREKTIHILEHDFDMVQEEAMLALDMAL